MSGRRKVNAMRCRSPPAPPAHGAQVGYFLAAGVFFAVVLRAAGFRVVLLRVVLVAVALAATAGSDGAAASPAPALSAVLSPSASPVPSEPSVLSAPSAPVCAVAFFTTRASRSISFSPRRPHQASAPGATTPARSPVLQLCRYAAQRRAPCRAWREPRRAYHCRR